MVPSLLVIFVSPEGTVRPLVYSALAVVNVEAALAASLIFLPFLQSFIILSFLYINFNSKYNKNNSAQFIIEKNYKSEQKSPLRNDILTFTDTSFIQYFNKFCDDNKKLINIILKKYPYQFPRGLIIIISKILDLENKKKYFKQELRKLPYKSDYQRIKVRRNGVDLFNDSFNALSSKKSEQWRSKLIVTFEGEEAIDAGGVKREWLTLLSKEMFNPNYMLFTLAKMVLLILSIKIVVDIIWII